MRAARVLPVPGAMVFLWSAVLHGPMSRRGTLVSGVQTPSGSFQSDLVVIVVVVFASYSLAVVEFLRENTCF